LNILGEDTLPGGNLSQCADRHRRRELSEFCVLKKNPLRDLHRVVEHPVALSKKLLKHKDIQEGIHISPSTGERKKDKIP
jgi:hypothetical protein